MGFLRFVDRFKRQMKNIAAMIVCVIFIVFLYLVVASMQWIDWPFFHFSHGKYKCLTVHFNFLHIHCPLHLNPKTTSMFHVIFLSE